VQVGALLSAGWLAYRSRGSASIRLGLFGALALAASLVIWGATVAPVNAEWAQLIQSGSDSLPDAYARLRWRWEYGHVAAFAAWFAGYCLLQLSVLRSDRVNPRA
jgi:hypothetical protein